MPEVATNQGTVTAILAMALEHLSARAVTLVSLAMTFGLYCWGIWRGDWAGIAVPSAFAVLVFLPVLWRHVPCPSK